jgi:hypothetical protein
MLSEDRKDLIFTILCCIFLAGLYFSKAVLSIAPYLLLALGLFRSNLSNRLKTFYRVKPFGILTGLFLLYLFSGLNSIDKASWWRRLDNNFIYLTNPTIIICLGRLLSPLFFTPALACLSPVRFCVAFTCGEKSLNGICLLKTDYYSLPCSFRLYFYIFSPCERVSFLFI